MKKFLLVLVLLLSTSVYVSADEGMWLLQYLEKMNIKDMRSKGFKLSAKDIYNLNGNAIKDAIVIFGGGCTGEIVSSEGLLLTNHHCGYGAIQQHSTVEKDYLENGFWAMDRKEEIPTPGLSVTFIREIKDVTDMILPSLNDDMSQWDRQSKIMELSAEIERNAFEKGSSRRASVSSIFGGNQFLLVVTERYGDVRLVGAPPSSIGKFGGDTDNWMWPRHTGDFSMFRVYSDKDGKPAEYSSENVPYKAPSHLNISLKGYKAGDFAMVIGFPGSTNRYMTSYEIDYMLETDNPNRIYVRGERQELMMEDMLANDTVRIQYASKYSGSSNYWKNSIGMSRGLKKLGVRAQKEETENAFRAWVESDPARMEKYGKALPMIKDYVEGRASAAGNMQILSEALMRGTEIITAVRAGGGITNGKNMLDSARIEASKRNMEAFYKDYSPTTDRKIAKRMFAIVRDMVDKEKLPSTFGFIDASFGGDVDAYIDYVYDNSLFANREAYLEFMEDPDATVLANDPAYKMTREVTEAYNKLVPEMAKYQEFYEKGHRLYIEGLMEMNKDKNYYPDANFTMRLTYGNILPYDPQDAVTYHYTTTLGGVISKEDPDNAYEFTVPDKLKELYKNKDFGPYGGKDELVVNFISNNDITGGNSGSPVLNAKGQLIGLAFDGNWEAMSGDIAFEPELQRCINVDIRYVLFIIDKYAGAGYLLDEMTIVK